MSEGAVVLHNPSGKRIEPNSLRHRVIAAVPVPLGSDHALDRDAQAAYVRWMAEGPMDGVAVWAHTGRGLNLEVELAVEVLTSWRNGLREDQLVVAAAGSARSITEPKQVIEAARTMARRAADIGADALLVHPPTALRDHPDRDRHIVDYHEAVAQVGLPLILFYLYEAAGGISYSEPVLDELLGRSEVLGIKLATLDSVMTYQDVARLIRLNHPEKVLITGEDRFLGYSLMCGAEAALIGMASACTKIQSSFLKSYWNGDYQRFLDLNPIIDDLAQHTFSRPLEGYIQRMLRCLVREGVISARSAHDPWGPELSREDLNRLDDCLNRILSV